MLRRRQVLGGALACGGVLALAGRHARAADPKFSRLLVLNASGGLRSTAAFNAKPQGDANPWGVAGTAGELVLGNLLTSVPADLRYAAPSWAGGTTVPSITAAAQSFAMIGGCDHSPGLHRQGDHPDETPRMGTGYFGKPSAPGLMTAINRHLGADAPGPVAMIGGGGALGNAVGDWVAYGPVRLEWYGLPPAPPTGGSPTVGRPIEDAIDDRLRTGRRSLGKNKVDAYWATKDALRRYGPVLADPALKIGQVGQLDVDLGGVTNRMLLEAMGNDLSTGGTGEPMGVRAAMGIRLLQMGSPAVTVDVGGFDFHDAEDVGGPAVYTLFARLVAGIHFALANTLDDDGAPLLDSTLVVTTSECSRTSPAGGFNDAGGSDHGGDDPAWRWQAHVVFGAGVSPKVLAPTDDENVPTGGTGASTHALLATLCEGLGVPEDGVAELWPPGSELYPEAAPMMELFD
jgi:uncharacterized protein (DUF1501 family)